LVRTNADAPKHRGISWLIMPMDSPGLEVRPIRTAYGDSEFSEMFLDEVRIPVANLVGAENDGWRVAMVTFSFERGTAFISDVISSAQDLRDLADIARKVLRRGAPAWEDAEIRREIGRLQADFDAMWALTKRNVSQAQRTGIVGPGGSVFKLFLADVKKRSSALAYKLLGRMTTAYNDLGEMTEIDFVADRISTLTLSIAAGTSQIQRNIIAERVLGLPKER
jgi:alkylation response protein AidB-like acyl-CoA dehydrogenase